jgi:inhibitor of cysteine peptidase
MRVLAPLAVSVLLLSCSTSNHSAKSGGNPDLIEGIGTVRYQDLEGGFYGIVADDSAKYDPGSLPMAVRKEGLRVRFTATRVGGMTTRMWGTRVELKNIEPIE